MTETQGQIISGVLILFVVPLFITLILDIVPETALKFLNIRDFLNILQGMLIGMWIYRYFWKG